MQLPNTFCGIYYPTTDSTSPRCPIPLEHLDVHASIVDVLAVVTLTQKFWQYLPTAAERAKYVFPVPSRAAVCGFEMRTEDGRIVRAVSKEKEQARKEHEAAIKQGKMTGLVEHVTDDIFSISLGTLPASQIITTVVTYVLDLMDADLIGQVRFQLPVSIGMRYGSPPEGMLSSLRLSSRVQIIADIRTKGPIQSIFCPTHNIDNSDTSAQYSSDKFLEEDFVLMIKADGYNEPRCFAERHPSGTTAFQLNMVPNFEAPPITAQEYIFLIDRSGSMSGDRIATAKKTLVMLLRALPGKGTTFNIWSFGSSYDTLFPESAVYSETALATVTAYVDEMDANYGGTEIRTPLEAIFKARSRTVPTACFLLTDGETYDIDNTIATVSQAVKSSPGEAPLRVFTLGIGESVSSAMVEGIARAGNGVCLMAATAESILAKSAKLVRASRTHFLTNATIDWGTDFNSSVDVTSQADMLRQAPLQLPPLYTGNRFIVFALIKRPNFTIPKKVIVRGSLHGREDVAIEVPVTELPLPRVDSQPHMIHTLAARRIIQDLDDADRNVNAPATKSAIVHLGEQYQLASRYTSFIAVDNSGIVAEDSFPSSVTEPLMDFAPAMGHYLSMPPGGSALMNAGNLRMKSVMASGPSRPLAQPAQSPVPRSHAPAAFFSPVPPSSMAAPPPPPPIIPQVASSAASFSQRHTVLRESAPSPVLPGRERNRETVQLNTSSAQTTIADAPPFPAPVPQLKANVDVDTQVLELIRLQSFDGSFPDSVAVAQILGRSALDKAAEYGVDMRVWTAVLAIAYFEKHLTGQPELLEGVVEKITEFLNDENVDSGQIGELLIKAKLAIA